MHRAVTDEARLFLEWLPGRLAEDARALTSAATRLPIDIFSVLERLRIRLEFSNRENRGHGGHLTRYSHGWTVVLSRSAALGSSDRVTSRDRFTIAHEIGHYLVEGRFGFRPASGGEYWLLEEACNLFALDLLAPDHLLADVLHAEPRTASELLELVGRLSRQAAISREPATRRLIARLHTRCALLQLRLKAGATSDRWKVGWCVDNNRWIAPPPRRGANVTGPIASLVEVLLDANSTIERARQADPIFSGLNDVCIDRGHRSDRLMALIFD